MSERPLLGKVNGPSDLRFMTENELVSLCGELRDYLIETVSRTGGHLASNLGAVELSVGIHKVFESPKDKIIFDVGHQSYVHKILTGRRDGFSTLRSLGGISGFMRPDESVHDPVITGHASTSVSSAIGLARAMRLRGEKGKVVCIIGDGAMTGGMSYEALNDLGETDLPVIVVFNDNDMSINKSVGAVAKRLSKIRLKPRYFKFKASLKKFFNRFAGGEKMIKLLSSLKNNIKIALLKETLFEILGLKYLGPADGNDIKTVVDLLTEAKRMEGPVVVHFKTVKGKGFTPAETDPDKYHGVSAKKAGVSCGVSCAAAFSKALDELGGRDDRICAVTAAMESGTGLKAFHQKHPDRFFDVGISEEHAVTMAAGMAAGGLVPIVCLYSTFIQRAYDQIIHDVSIAKLHVVFAVDHSGIVGEDGATHHGLLDVGFLSTVPGMTIYAPASPSELGSALNKAVYECEGPVSVIYPKEFHSSYSQDHMDSDGYLLRQGEDMELVCYGQTVPLALGTADVLAKRGKRVAVRKLSRLDNYRPEAGKKTMIIESCLESAGLGRIHGIRSYNFGREFVPCGSVDELYEAFGMSAEKIAEDILNG